MTALNQLLAGGRLLASAVQGIAPLASYKGSDETVTSSTTLQNDDALWLPVQPNTTLIWLLWLHGTGAANGSGDLKITFTWPTGSTGVWGSLGYATSGLTANINAVRTASAATGSVFGLNGATPAMGLAMGSLVVGGTAGSLRLQWAQNTSSSTGSVVKAGSWLAAWQVA